MNGRSKLLMMCFSSLPSKGVRQFQMFVIYRIGFYFLKEATCMKDFLFFGRQLVLFFCSNERRLGAGFVCSEGQRSICQQ